EARSSPGAQSADAGHRGVPLGADSRRVAGGRPAGDRGGDLAGAPAGLLAGVPPRRVPVRGAYLMSGAEIALEGVWKKFRRGERFDSLRDLLPAVARGLFRGRLKAELDREEFWALEDLSFRGGAGEALGIIGPNGAGKTTVLRVLTRLLRPTRGRCHVYGRIGALIDVSGGFHADLTGRENVFLRGAIVGM